MLLILENNFCQEVETLTKEQKEKAVIYPGKTLMDEEFKIYDMEAGKIAPVVRFLVEGKQKKNFMLIFLIILGFVIFLGILIFAFYPKKEITPIQPVITAVQPIEIQPIATQPIATQPIATQPIEIQPIVTQPGVIQGTPENIQNNNIELQKNLMEIDLIKTQNKYDLQNLQMDLNDKIKELDKIKLENIQLLKDIELQKIEINNLTVKKNNNPADDFIYYLGNSVYKKCEANKIDSNYNLCKNLYYNFLNYGKDR